MALYVPSLDRANTTEECERRYMDRVSVNLAEEDILRLTQEANRRGVPASTMVRMVVREWLDDHVGSLDFHVRPASTPVRLTEQKNAIRRIRKAEK